MWWKKKKEDDVKLQELLSNIPEYLAWLKDYRSEGTKRSYEMVLEQFVNHVKTLPNDINPERAVLSYLHSKREEGGISITTANYRRSIIRTFFDFVEYPLNKKLVPVIPKQHKDSFEQDKYVPYEELKKMIDVADTKDNEKLIVTTFLLTGARLSEVCMIRFMDYNLESDDVFSINIVTLKSRANNKDRTLYITPKWAVDIIKNSLQSAISKEERIWKGTSDNLRQRIYKIAKRAGLEGVHPHSFRHALTSYLLNVKNVPIGVVQAIDAHEDIKTTGGYSHAKQQQIKEGMSKLD